MHIKNIKSAGQTNERLLKALAALLMPSSVDTAHTWYKDTHMSKINMHKYISKNEIKAGVGARFCNYKERTNIFYLNGDFANVLILRKWSEKYLLNCFFANNDILHILDT